MTIIMLILVKKLAHLNQVDEIKVAEIDLFFELKLNFVIITSNDSAPRSSHLAFVHNTANICV